MDTLLEALASWRPFRAVVVGDFMLDQLVRGDATRLSADAPVPVLHAGEVEDRAGGAANLCLNLAALHADVAAVGVLGDDPEGVRLAAALGEAGLTGRVDTAGLVMDASRPTTVKRNLVGLAQGRHPQKMFRVDVEDRSPLAAEVRARLMDAAEQALAEADVLCIEDYGKGVCTEPVCRRLIETARARGVPVLVDPAAGADFHIYRGATAISPNRTEAELATGLRTGDGEDRAAGLEQTAAVAHALVTALDLEAVVLTLDRHGAMLLEAGAPAPVAVPTVARDVYDVTGAGDMMLAALAAARCNAIAWADAVRFANAAAGLEVESFGVVPIPFERIHHDLLVAAIGTRGSDRIRTLEQLRIELAALRGVGKRIVFTNGCFDVLHAGHVTLLEKAREFGDFLVVAVNSDDSVRKLKGEGRPINRAEDRARLLAALRAVDALIFFEEDTPIRIIEALTPDVLVKGSDYAVDEVVGREVLQRTGGRVELVDLLEGRSTTAMIERAQRT